MDYYEKLTQTISFVENEQLENIDTGLLQIFLRRHRATILSKLNWQLKTLILLYKYPPDLLSSSENIFGKSVNKQREEALSNLINEIITIVKKCPSLSCHIKQKFREEHINFDDSTLDSTELSKLQNFLKVN